jgi:hypothetical protein
MMFRGRLVALVTVLASLGTAAAADAALQWQAQESLPGAPTSVNLSPDGVGLLMGFPAGAAPGFLIRPLGGPLGSPQALPAGMGTGEPPVVGWFPDGSSLIGDATVPLVAFRPTGAGASIGIPQNLGSGASTVAIATAPTGEAMIGLDKNVRVAFRSAGPAGVVDMAHAQTFGEGRLIGVALDPAGGAVVVFIPKETQTIEQAVRKPGDSSFGAPVVIPSVSPFKLTMASDPSGYAELAWRGGPNGTEGFPTEVMVATRAPGGAFGEPQVLAKEAAGVPGGALPAITANGDGLVAWTEVTLSECPIKGNDASAGAFFATSHGGKWKSGGALGETAWPAISAIDGVASAGNSVAIASHTINDFDSRCKPPTDESESTFVTTGTSDATGIHLEGSTPIGSAIQIENGQYLSPVFRRLAVNPAGAALYAYEQYPNFYLVPREDRTPAPGGGGGGGGGGTGGGAGGGGGTVPPVLHHILPIVPRALIVVVPLNPANPTYIATCPPEVADECAMRVAAYAAFGAIPSRVGHKKAALLGAGTLTLKPGTHGRIKIRFTAAGKRTLSTGRQLKIRIRVDVTASGQRASFTTATKIRARRHKKH